MPSHPERIRPTTESMTDSSLAQRTLQRVKDRLAASKGTGVSQMIRLIHELTSQSDSLSVQSLSELVSREPVILKKILEVANTLGYNPAGVPIDNLDIGIQVIGFEKVRNLAVSLMLAGNAEDQLNPEEVRECAALALTTGLVARELAKRGGNFDPELGFVCAILRNYGRLLMAQFLSEDYKEARGLAAAMTADEAYISVFGLTPLELSYHLLKASQLPKQLQDALEKVPAYVVTTAAFTHEDDLLALTDMAARLCEVVDAVDLTPADFPRRAAEILTSGGSPGGTGPEEIGAMFKEVHRQLSAIREAHRATAFTCPLLARVDALATGQPLPPPLVSLPRPARPATPDPKAPAASPAPAVSTAASPQTSAENRLERGIRDLAALFDSRVVDATQAFRIAERVLSSSLHLLHCVILVEEPGTPQLYARFGSGELFERQRNKPLAHRNGKDVFMVALARGEDVLIESPKDPKILPFLPPWLQEAAGELPIILLPIPHGTRSFGIICGISRDREAFGIVSRCAKETKEIRGYLSRIEPGSV